jgi:predicted O-methyltransferase YrrM
MPHGLAVWRERRTVAERDERQAEALARAAARRTSDYSVDAAIDFLAGRGLVEAHVRAGSIPEGSLEFAGALLRAHLPRDRPLRGLHVGNFVGVSLSYFSALAREVHADSVVVSVDPNIRHQRIPDPQSHVIALLHHFGLLGNSLVVPGYTLEQNLGDPLPGASDDRYLDELACEGVLASLSRVDAGPFDFVMLDGNHDHAYLRREFDALRALLKPGTIVVFDDVNEFWPGVQTVFHDAIAAGQAEATELGADGRVGVLQVDAGR